MLLIFSCFHGDLFSREKQNWTENLYRKVPAALLTWPEGGNKPNIHQLMSRQTKYVLLCLAAQLCLTLWTPWTVARQVPLSMRILQARILEWVAYSFSRGTSWPRNWIQSPTLQANSLPVELPGKPQQNILHPYNTILFYHEKEMKYWCMIQHG